jgi:hypothetical protein
VEEGGLEVTERHVHSKEVGYIEKEEMLPYHTALLILNSGTTENTRL